MNTKTTNPPKAKQTHTHVFTRSKPTATVETCTCGKFRFTENAGEPIVAQDKTAKAKRAKSETTKAWREFADKYGPDLAKEHTPDETPEAPKAKRANATEHRCSNCNVLISSAKNLCHACDLELAEWQRKRMNTEAPLGRCPKCNKPLRYYDGCLGYEAARCDACNFERDLNAEANGNPIEGELGTKQDKTAHTPGPWKTAFRWQGGNGIDAYVSIVSEDQGVSYAFGNSEGEREANARLIAAAPDLLEAARFSESVLRACRGELQPERDAAIHGLQNAIAKAEGRS